MSSSRARSLRERMSIDPDRPMASPSESDAPSSTAEEGVETSDKEQSTTGDATNVGHSGDGYPATTKESAERSGHREDRSTPPDAVGGPPREDPSPHEFMRPPDPKDIPTSLGRTARDSRPQPWDDLGWTTALDDPAMSAGSSSYRSFYVRDDIFARFRSAVYWTARRSLDAPDNMSAGVEEYMDAVATELEHRYNRRGVFPPTPDQVKAHHRRQAKKR